ncbi:MAG: hypothetical protein A3G18_12835 [Rhodospirillales bacterium RIFCSPLOWO2_12_FULL_58_28]|nr:MAG: hypothetical protein A3H92_12690 [Rhodospirillales bacterium RIFCSPLOWO2_02_FULL_58_16]OHC78472.1 MAG: hypothetical protein A3G18_12835 [Rhodospirillales bacterium RIFCSPLOWO2_12_FULL_58_28]
MALASTQNTPFTVTVGNWLFRTRNWVFPLTVVTLFAAFRPAPFNGDPAADFWLNLIGIATAVAGMSFRGWVIGLAYIKRGGLNKRVHAATLVTQGMFGVCRNPLYVGNMLAYLGLFILHNGVWVYVLGCLAFGFYYWCIVRAEETFLADKFGEDYQRYCREVPRFLPDFRLYRRASQDMTFHWKRVLAKDYSTVGGWFVAAVLTHAYEGWAWRGAADIKGAALWAAAIIILALFVRTLKKANLLAE